MRGLTPEERAAITTEPVWCSRQTGEALVARGLLQVTERHANGRPAFAVPTPAGFLALRLDALARAGLGV